MAKTKTIAKKLSKPASAAGTVPAFDLDEFVGKYIWLLVPVLVLLYWWFSTGSTGFYQDDEIGHYRNIRQFWGDPFSIMGNQPKPGWKILMVIPGLFGSTGVLLAHCLIAALTVVATFQLGRALKLRNASVAALLLAVQPLFLQLSFRSYGEITAGLIAVLMLVFYYRGNLVLAALASSYIFSIRQEFALVSLGLGVIFAFKRKWVPLLLLGWTPVVLALIGWGVTGNALWLLDDMRRIGLNVQVPHKPFWHYFGTYIFMVGPVVLALFVVGYWSFLRKPAEWKKAISSHGFLFFVFTIMWAWSVFSAWDVPNFGANPGHWRYLLSIAPLTAVYAGMGLNVLFDPKSRGYVYGMLLAFSVIVLAFLSRESNGLTLTDAVSYTNLLYALGVVLVFVLFASARFLNGAALVGALMLLAVVYTVTEEKPRKLDSESQTMKNVSAWYLSQPAEFRQRPLYCNHVLMKYFADIDINDKNRDHPLQKVTLEKAARGSIIIWDSHYGNSQFGGDVPLEYFDGNPKFKSLHEFIAPDRRFGALVFEKIE